MFKVFLLLPVVLFILVSYPPIVKAEHKVTISHMIGREDITVTAIEEGESVDIATRGCANTAQVRFFYYYPGIDINQAIHIGTFTAAGGKAAIAKYSFSQPSNLTKPVSITIFAECSDHKALSILTINPKDPNKEQPDIPAPVPKPSKSISDIGNLNPNESKSVTVVGLDNNLTYSWTVSKMVPINLLENRDYRLLTTECALSDSGGRIIKKLGPYYTPGLYRLSITRPNTSDSPCLPSSNPILSQDFSVGGSTEKSCCGILPYNKNNDTCISFTIKVPFTQNAELPTECKSTGTFCEPDSLKCFKTKSIEGGKICIYPTDKNFEDKKKDTSKYTICATGGGDPCDVDKQQRGPGIKTAIGCIHTNPAEFVKDFMVFIIGIGGGLAFLMMLLGAFQMLTSAGNPETLNAGRERLTSAVIGLLFIIFAVLFLQIIGVDILNIPGFGR